MELFRKSFLVFLFFCVIFQFRIPFFYNSLILVGVFVFVKIIFDALCGKKYFVAEGFICYRLFVSFFLILGLFTIIVAFSSLEFDFFRLKTVLSNLVTLSISFALIIAFKPHIIKYNLLLILLQVFAIQSVVIIICILFPEVSEALSVFRSPIDSEIASKYDGIRGNALAGSQFFPLAACFSLVQIFFVFYVLEQKKCSFSILLCYVLVSFAGLSVGRTSIIGTAFSLVLLFILSLFNPLVRNVFLRLLSLYFFVCLTLFVFILISDNLVLLIKFSEFAFEFVYNYLEHGEVTTSSTQILSKMYFYISLQDFIFGFSRFVFPNSDRPFLETDAGYMRDIIHFGFGLTFLLYSFLIFYFVLIYKKIRFFLSYSVAMSFCSFMLFLILTLHYKGSVILNLVSFTAMLYFFIVYTYQRVSLKKICKFHRVNDS